VNTSAISTALPQYRLLVWDRIRSLYNGLSYVVALCVIQGLWWSIQAALPQLIAGNAHEFVRDLLHAAWANWFSMLAGPVVVPVVVNLAPRTGLLRIGFLLLAIIPMAWWCLSVADGVSFGWNWRSLGLALDGLLTPGLVVWVCAYHSHSREAADSLLRLRIGQTRMAAELQRAQLNLLRAQIEPHFLFNTLSVVQALARNDRRATVEILDNLIRYFAAALPKLSGNEVPLAQEMQLVDAYLAIYRARMGTRLIYEIALPEDLEQVQIPSMMLLTLVENALKHGVGPNVEGGSIRVSAESERGWLRLAVADSGRGLAFRHGRGAGLANIRQRLLMMYGSGAMLSLKPAEPRGLVASILLPVL
jgi:signal transduction histidine kinase